MTRCDYITFFMYQVFSRDKLFAWSSESPQKPWEIISSSLLPQPFDTDSCPDPKAPDTDVGTSPSRSYPFAPSRQLLFTPRDSTEILNSFLSCLFFQITSNSTLFDSFLKTEVNTFDNRPKLSCFRFFVRHSLSPLNVNDSPKYCDYFD